MTATQSPTLSFPAPPGRNGNADSEAFAKEQESLRRAMPTQRLIGGGMRADDALLLHSLTSNGVAWQDAAIWLGERNMLLAQSARAPEVAKAWYRYASASYRFGHGAIPVDNDEKRRIHGYMVDAFARAAALDDPVTEKLSVDWNDGKLCGWLMRPTGSGSYPAVIIMGGFDGWREEYYSGAVRLVEAGIAVALFDGPGQGETRLQHGVFLGVDFPQAFSQIAQTLRQYAGINGEVGIWGNSLGGYLAARVAAEDPSISAVCINGGSYNPIELPHRFPRFWSKVEALFGLDSQDAAEGRMAHFTLEGVAQNIRCPLLQLHGVPDQVFLLENARRIYDEAASENKTLLIWDDGDHCIYNHTEEKNLVVADWFAKVLKR